MKINQQALNPASEEPRHFYAYCCFGWATADSAAGAAEKLVNAFKYDFPGMEDGTQDDTAAKFWVIRVDLPGDSTYHISHFVPVVDKQKLEYVVEATFAESDELLEALRTSAF